MARFLRQDESCPRCVDALIAKAERLIEASDPGLRAAAISQANSVKAALDETGVSKIAPDLVRRCEAVIRRAPHGIGQGS